jgi:hypothetical protein
MKRFHNFIILLFFAGLIPSYGQDLYSVKNSIKFADYLFENGEYQFAAKEYYRLFIITDYNDSVSTRFAKSMFLAKEYQELKNALNKSYGSGNIPCNISSYYAKSLIISEPGSMSGFWINNSNCFNNEEKKYLKLSNLLLSHQYQDASRLYHTENDNTRVKSYNNVIASIDNAKYKKVWLSVLFSSLVPGTGKAYCGYWKDGLFSFIMFGLSAWQAYSGFNRKGVNSVYGWVNGGLALAFYSGNIYGSIKAANHHNYSIDHQIYHEAEKVFLLPD